MRMVQEVPVVLFVFNRHEQLAKTLECLKNNKIPMLYVFADGPRNSKDNESINKVRKLIDSIDWTNVEKIYYTKNKGLSQSIQDGLDKVFKKNDKVIVIEDDVVVAPKFYDFMSTCLHKYQDLNSVAGVTGLRYPFSGEHLNTDPYDVFVTPRFSSWGWGTWKREWDRIIFDRRELLQKLTEKNVDEAAGGADLPHAIDEIKADRLSGGWDVYFYANMLINNQLFIWPKKNFVKNTGFTEGSHADSALELSWKLSWESTEQNSWNLPHEPDINAKILKDFLSFLDPVNLYKLSRMQKMKRLLNKLT